MERILSLLPEPDTQRWMIGCLDGGENIDWQGNDVSYSILDQDTMVFLKHVLEDHIELYLDSNNDESFDSDDQLIGSANLEQQLKGQTHGRFLM